MGSEKGSSCLGLHVLRPVAGPLYISNGLDFTYGDRAAGPLEYSKNLERRRLSVPRHLKADWRQTAQFEPPGSI